MPKLSRIHIYPVKSFDAQSVDSSVLLASGGLQHDRRFALVDRSGDFVNGKRFPSIQRLRSRFDPASGQLSLQVDGQGPQHTFDLQGNRSKLVAWLSDYFGQPIAIQENTTGGFPDDVESPGPTLISTATLAEVASWFPGVTLDECRDRFRANLEIDADEPFWEDRLLAAGLGAVRFQIGEAQLLGTNPCARCPVPPQSLHGRGDPRVCQDLRPTPAGRAARLGPGRALRPLLSPQREHPAGPCARSHAARRRRTRNPRRRAAQLRAAPRR